MKKAKAIELLKLAVPIKALTQQEYSDFVEAVNMGVDALEQPTSPDTIDRKAVIDAVDIGAELLRRVLDDTDVVGAEREKYAWGLGLIEACIADVKELPSAQPEPHEGYWINGKCDRCGEHAPFWAMASTYHESNYCPNCGAKMKGAEHEAD